jgi:hypothetical protein
VAKVAFVGSRWRVGADEEMPAGKTFCCNRRSFENSMGELDPSFLSHGASIHSKNSVETARHFSVSDGALISSDRAVVRSPLTVDARMRHQRDTGYKNMLAPVRDPTHHDVVKSHRGRQVRHPRSPSHPEKKRSKWGCKTRRSQTTPTPHVPCPPHSPRRFKRGRLRRRRGRRRLPRPRPRGPTAPSTATMDNDRTVAHSDSDDQEYDDETKPSIVDDLAWGRCVGAGTFGRVSFATHLPTGTPCAGEDLAQVRDPTDRPAGPREVGKSSPWKPSVTRSLFDSSARRKTRIASTSSWSSREAGRCSDTSEGKAGSVRSRARFYASEIACAISHLHRRGVAYRDLKPENGKSLF